MNKRTPGNDAGKNATKRTRRPTDEQIRQFDLDFEADFHVVRSLAPHLNDEELLYLASNSGLKSFAPALLHVLGTANKRRDAKLTKLLDSIFAAVKLSADDPVEQRVMEHLCRKADAYTGRLTFSDVLNWVADELAGYALAVEAMRYDRVQSLADFGELYSEGRGALLGGIRRGLIDCADLCPDLGDESHIGDDVSELEQRAWLRIWENLPAWTAPGSAAITTRLFAFGQWQARGWKTERLRERDRLRRIEDVMQQYGIRPEDEDDEPIAA